jgi:hypothetical protein
MQLRIVAKAARGAAFRRLESPPHVSLLPSCAITCPPAESGAVAGPEHVLGDRLHWLPAQS